LYNICCSIRCSSVRELLSHCSYALLSAPQLCQQFACGA
jgi:hypothetical protein